MTDFDALLNQELQQPRGWFYLSFADESGFLGGVIVQAHGILTAVHEARERGLNPGGEVLCLPWKGTPLPQAQYVLMNREQIDTLLGGAEPFSTHQDSV